VWIKENGGPLALVVLGLALAGFTTVYGWFLVPFGLVWWLGSPLLKRLPWELRRRHQLTAEPPVVEPTEPTPSWRQLNDARVKRYEASRGLFLIHRWWPSEKEGLVAHVVLELCQHQDGPLSRGEVQAVEYTFGPKFSSHSIVSKNAEESFAVTVSLYAPMLCLAKVYLTGDRAPLLLDRYVNFDQEGS
jgi:hypothetical protein